MNKLIYTLVILFITMSTNADIINVPADQPTIQSGINATANGDTVLVQPGIYPENINYNGRNITVASMFLTTGIVRYISQSIIEGTGTNSVVVFDDDEDSTSVLCGFTITNGNAYMGGGIRCINSSPTLKNLVIKENTAVRGGGVYIENSAVHIYVADIINNSAIKITGGGTQPDAFGGGIYCESASPEFINVNISENLTRAPGGSCCGGGLFSVESILLLQNVTIWNNVAEPRQNPNYYNSWGGGIYSFDSVMFLSNVSISGNYAEKGGGISGGKGIIFDSINRCDIYLNRAMLGNDLYGGIPQVIVDTFTVMIPNQFHAYPLEEYTFNINAGYWEQEEADLYVSPQGSYANTGLSPDEPLLNVWCAFSKILVDSLHPHTIHLMEGLYSKDNNEEVFPFRVQSYISLSGESQDNVVVDADSITNVMIFDHGYDINISNLTITGGRSFKGGGIESNFSDAFLQNLTIKGNSTFWYEYGGGGVYCKNTLLELQNVTISENSSVNGGGIFIEASNPLLQNCCIENNYATLGGGMYCSEGTKPELKFTTIKDNTALDKGGGIYINLSEPVFDESYRCNIFLNAALYGNDLYSDTTAHIVVDTFTVLYPTEFHAEPFQNFTFDILNGKVQQVDADLYVSPQGDNSNNGLTPDEPFKTIRYALSAILPDSIYPNTLHLLEGTYSNSENGEIFPINFPDNINLQGIVENDVILDAEGQSGVMIIDNNSSNLITGLTITGGTSMYGSGMAIYYSNPSIQDVSIINNVNNDYWSYGGGIYCTYSDPFLHDVNISNNTAQRGGGIYLHYSNPHLVEVTISNNEIYHPHVEGNGGGINCYHSDPLLEDVLISGNIAGNGGGMYCYHSDPIIQYTEISENTAKDNEGTGGGGICCIDSNPVFSNVDILDNTAYEFAIIGGGGIYCFNSNPVMSQVLISGNNSTNGGGIYLENSNPELVHVMITNNTTNSNNTQDKGGGGMFCKISNPVLQNVIVDSNYTDRNGGGIVCSGSNPSLINIQIAGNYAGWNGGGIYCFNYSNPFIVNATIVNNTTQQSGGAINTDAECYPEMVNTVVWGNAPDQINGNEIDVMFSNIQGGWEGEGNIDEDPFFVGTGDYPFALLDESPCINTGTPDTTGLNLPATDLAGNPRIFGVRIDMGAYENQNVAIRIPNDYRGEQTDLTCHPNPFTDEFTITCHLPFNSNVRIEFADAEGKMVKEHLFAHQPEGKHQYHFHKKDWPAGVYFIHLQAGKNLISGKILKMK